MTTENLLWLFGGMLIGWNLIPQPKFISDLIAQIFSIFKK